jgi:hypothetical protein
MGSAKDSMEGRLKPTDSRKQCAIDNAKEFPTAAEVSMRDFYVDDLLTSTDTIEQAEALKKDLIKLLKQGSFELAKWQSNYAPLSELNDPVKSVQLSEHVSVLGLRWDFKQDEFHFKLTPSLSPKAVTKRYITSEAAKIFDPHGWVSPVIIRAKLIIQELWRAGDDWDKPVEEKIRQEWAQLYEELPAIEQIRIPRWLQTTSNRETQVHMFADASSKAYGVVVYVRTKINDTWKAQLLCSRNKVAPLKPITIGIMCIGIKLQFS